MKPLGRQGRIRTKFRTKVLSILGNKDHGEILYLNSNVMTIRVSTRYTCSTQLCFKLNRSPFIDPLLSFLPSTYRFDLVVQQGPSFDIGSFGATGLRRLQNATQVRTSVLNFFNTYCAQTKCLEWIILRSPYPHFLLDLLHFGSIHGGL